MLNSCLDANLDINTSAGQAWVTLHVRLGHEPGLLLRPPAHSHGHQPGTRNSPPRQCCRHIRAAARAEQQAGNEEAEKAVNEESGKDENYESEL
jgi:hypothetical protein